MEKRISRLECRIRDLVGREFPSCVVITQRDPRGATVRLSPPSRQGRVEDYGLCVLA